MVFFSDTCQLMAANVCHKIPLTMIGHTQFSCQLWTTTSSASSQCPSIESSSSDWASCKPKLVTCSGNSHPAYIACVYFLFLVSVFSCLLLCHTCFVTMLSLLHLSSLRYICTLCHYCHVLFRLLLLSFATLCYSCHSHFVVLLTLCHSCHCHLWHFSHQLLFFLITCTFFVVCETQLHISGRSQHAASRRSAPRASPPYDASRCAESPWRR